MKKLIYVLLMLLMYALSVFGFVPGLVSSLVLSFGALYMVYGCTRFGSTISVGH